jgi:hypothetical protein
MGAFCTVSYGVGGDFYRLVSSSNSQVSYQLIWKMTLLLLCLLSTTTTSTTAKKESRFDVNISYTIHGVVSGRPFDRFLLNQVDVDPHSTIFSIITSPIIMTGIYDYLINTRRFAIIGNYGSSSIGIISKTIVTFIISYSSSINEDGYDFNDYFVLIGHRFYDYSIRRWYISSLISLNGSNNFGYAINATDITATCKLILLLLLIMLYKLLFTIIMISIRTMITTMILIMIKFHQDMIIIILIRSITIIILIQLKIVTLIIPIFQVFLSLVWFPVWTQV